MAVLAGGEYQISTEEFLPTGEEAEAGRRKAFKLSSPVRELSFDIDVYSCTDDEVVLFSQELQSRGIVDRLNYLDHADGYLLSSFNIKYRVDGLSRIFAEPIPVPREKAQEIVSDFSDSQISAIREERPFLVTVNIGINSSGSTPRGLIMRTRVTHIAYYPLTRPEISDTSIFDDFYIGMPTYQTFGNTSFPSIRPIYQRTYEE